MREVARQAFASLQCDIEPEIYAGCRFCGCYYTMVDGEIRRTNWCEDDEEAIERFNNWLAA